MTNNLSVTVFLHCYWWCCIVGKQGNNNKFHNIINIYWEIMVPTNFYWIKWDCQSWHSKVLKQRKTNWKIKFCYSFLKVLFSRKGAKNLANDHPLNYQEVLFTSFLLKNLQKRSRNGPTGYTFYYNRKTKSNKVLFLLFLVIFGNVTITLFHLTSFF